MELCGNVAPLPASDFVTFADYVGLKMSVPSFALKDFGLDPQMKPSTPVRISTDLLIRGV